MKNAWMKRWLVMTALAASAVVPVGAQDDAGSDPEAAAGAPSFHAHLGGFQEVPAVSTNGRGRFAAVVGEGGIAFVLEYRGLQGEWTPAVSLELAQAGVRGGLITLLCGGDGRPACPPGAGTVRGVIRPHEIVGPEAQGIEPGEIGEVVRALLHGRVSVNVRTTAFPGGEIRGQVLTDDHD